MEKLTRDRTPLVPRPPADHGSSGEDSPPTLPAGGLDLRVRRVATFTLIRLPRAASRLDFDLEGGAVDLLRSHLLRLLEAGQTRQVLDLAGLDATSARLLSCLAWHHCRLRERGGVFRLLGVGPSLASAIDACDLTKILELYESRADALLGRGRIEARARSAGREDARQEDPAPTGLGG